MLRLKMLPPTYWNAAIFGPARSEATHVTRKQISRERATVREHAASVYVERHVCAINSPSATESRVFKFNQTRRPKLTAAQATMKWPKYIQHVVSHRYTERDTDTICSYRQRSIRTALACCEAPRQSSCSTPYLSPFPLTQARALLIAVSLSPTPIKT